ncbi:hypothetical protein IPF37_03710 [bacterium]|nr:MAG: hypothetical protein IPF37_03710 [bacterium]
MQNEELKGQTARQIAQIKAQVEQQIAMVRTEAEKMTEQLKNDIDAKAVELNYQAEKEKLIIMSQAEHKALELKAEEQRRQLEQKFQRSVDISLDSKMTSFGAKDFSFNRVSVPAPALSLFSRSFSAMPTQTITPEWRNQISRDFYTDMSFMKNIIAEGETSDQVADFSQRFNKQNNWFDQTLSSTQSRADMSYKQLLDKQATLQSIVQAQKKADILLDQISVQKSLSDDQKKKARLAILYDINEQVQQEKNKFGSLERPLELDQNRINVVVRRAFEDYSNNFQTMTADVSGVEIKDGTTVHIIPVMVQKLQGELDQVKTELESTRNSLEKMRADKSLLKQQMNNELRNKTQEWLDLEIQLRQERSNLKHAQQEMSAAVQRMEKTTIEKEVLNAQVQAKTEENANLKDAVAKAQSNNELMTQHAGQAQERITKAEEQMRQAKQVARAAKQRVNDIQHDAQGHVQDLKDDLEQALQYAQAAEKRAELAEDKVAQAYAKSNEREERNQRQRERDRLQALEERDEAVESVKRLFIPRLEEEKRQGIDLKIQLEQAIAQAQKFEEKAEQLQAEVRVMQDRVTQARQDTAQAEALLRAQTTLRKEAEQHTSLVEELAGQMIDSINAYLQKERLAHEGREAQLLDEASVQRFKKISLKDQKRELEDLRDGAIEALEYHENQKEVATVRLRSMQNNLESLEHETLRLQVERAEREELEMVREQVRKERASMQNAEVVKSEELNEELE